MPPELRPLFGVRALVTFLAAAMLAAGLTSIRVGREPEAPHVVLLDDRPADTVAPAAETVGQPRDPVAVTVAPVELRVVVGDGLATRAGTLRGLESAAAPVAVAPPPPPAPPVEPRVREAPAPAPAPQVQAPPQPAAGTPAEVIPTAEPAELQPPATAQPAPDAAPPNPAPRPTTEPATPAPAPPPAPEPAPEPAPTPRPEPAPAPTTEPAPTPEPTPTPTPEPAPPPPPANEQSGGASWYHHPAGGMTAAHRTLPLGTAVTVTNLANGATVTVVINDRGPFIAGRVIDLNMEAFAVIADLNSGVIQVRITW